MVAETMQKMFSVKGVTGIILSVIILVVASFIPGSEELTRQGVMGLAIMAVAVVLWFCETFPAGVSGLLVLVLAPIFGVVTINQAFAGFGGTTVYFIIGVFSLTVVMMKTNLGQRLTRRLVNWAGASPTKLILAFMAGAALISTIITDTGAVIIVIGLALPFLQSIGHSPGKSNLGKCIMIGIAFAAILGGFVTPVGHSMNVLGMGMLTDFNGTTVGFIPWMIIGLPLCVVMLPVCCFFLVKLLKPESVSQEDIDKVLAETGNMGKMDAMEIKALIMLVGIPVLWVIGNWVPALNVTVVSIIGLAIMFLPGMNLLTWDDMQKGVPWNIVLMVGAILSLGSILGATGGAAYIAKLFLGSGILNLDPLVALLLIAIVLYLIHTFLPVAPALLAIFLPPLFAYAQAVGISPAIPMLLVVLMVSGNFIIPLNPTITVAYAKGYFSFGDVAKGGTISGILLVVLGTVWIYFMGGLLGI